MLTGCSVPSVASMSPDLPRKPAAPAPATIDAKPVAATASSSGAADSATTGTPTSALPVDRGDLSGGSVTRKLAAGERTLVIDYWTTADAKRLSAGTPFALQLSAHIEGGKADDGETPNAVKVSRFLATADDGTSTSTLSDDRGEFVVTPPYSYGTALTVRTGDPAATMVTLSVQFDLLIETAPESGAYFRQTVLDTVRIALPATPTGQPAQTDQPSQTDQQGAS